MNHRPIMTNDHRFRAIDVKSFCGDSREVSSQASTIQPVRIEELPIVNDLLASSQQTNQAVLSWRWDVHPTRGTSCNVAAALAYASSVGIDHLFLDIVSVDQTLTGHELVRAVIDFTSLFEHLCPIAAYDSDVIGVNSRHFLTVVRLPWIAREVHAMRSNPHKLRYVGHMRGQGTEPSFGIAHMMERVWSSNFANSILYVLTGGCDLYDVADLAFIMPEYHSQLMAAVARMSRNDVLITAALCSQLSNNDARVNGDIDIRNLSFEAYTFERPTAEPGYWTTWEITLNEKAVGRWSEKDYTRDGEHRRKLSASANTLPPDSTFPPPSANVDLSFRPDRLHATLQRSYHGKTM